MFTRPLLRWRRPGEGTERIIRALASAVLTLLSARAGAQGNVAGTVYDSLNARGPLANATVVLVERSRYVTTDARGRFQIDSVPDGHYTIGFLHPVLDSLDLQAPVVAIDVTSGHRTVVTLSTPGREAAYARLCPGVYATEVGVVVGRVRDVDDESWLADATVATDWAEFTLAAGRVARHDIRAVARTNRDGVYRLCGVPTDAPLTVRAEFGGFSAGPTPLVLNDRFIRRVDFAFSRKDSAAREVALGDSSTVTARVLGSASLRGVVLGDDGRAMRDVLVVILGTRRSGRTDGAGAFRIDHIPAGTRTVELRSIGFLPLTASMDFATNAKRDSSFSVTGQAQPLKPVTVKERGITLSLMENDGFEARRLHGLGAYLTARDIARHVFPDLASVLAGVRGVHIGYGTQGRPTPMLKGITDTKTGVYCIPNFFLDGAPFFVDLGDRPFAELSALVPPERIRGIEVYSTSGVIPLQYDLTSSTGCGSIVIWTR